MPVAHPKLRIGESPLPRAPCLISCAKVNCPQKATSYLAGECTPTPHLQVAERCYAC